MNYLYLHGFASSPNSYKATYMQRRFTELGLTLHVPDLNLTDFSKVTLSDQLAYLDRTYLQNQEPIAVIGSSLGGFLAVLLAAQNSLVQKLVLFAPAFGFGDRITQNIGAENIAQWEQDGSREFYHYGLKRNVNLQFQFLVDAQKYSEAQLTRSLPILIFHGIHDEVVPASLSREFAKKRSQVILKLLNDDHALGSDLINIWQDTKQFLEIS
ncbi:MAG: YqiA/YcfP family alpha/beta fold hydrolase [Pseudanabaena sp.]|jgi:pimeloyl-ACP methyl ester carboxylesterase|uniref:YqiA/YcfP family alpha/beta fold hydrolase n=1 Tax=Pseudanabaena mucicola TaxID=71190 RepID=UPI0025764B30|nr:YqiA/YcfP family alpha/beta fold hydrolase [Pseudanabaena mucicola]MCA6575100.1 alpha/beta fold hydrolase [Pseudanabaena sp. M53BS1SP1A06MG]MCA6582791.1 alpha/beta fold hydrolase [Pseudanabaena sp. M34BS1SP1A06MG]MCA6588163.1 alpha/beta fold hydrolase [Pseudanabaena sp. M109S1SP1A06QC]MCA6593259.1 alpha/beta fold hydrolase [Pseudanabaena sp. M38BS1SP1A06MG]MCA6596591.1 alpha/beta fold hydrolase [Pseudanabaena sp. M046S1SP1A06QC]MCA6601672.1 alpha/beta fold hydrolase [Pseudanabaena sp. M57B